MSAKEIYDTFAPLRDEWEVDHNVKVLYFIPPPTTTMCIVGAVPGLADLAGMEISGANWVADTLTRLGTSPLDIPVSQAYAAIETGVLDGGFFNAGATSAFKLYEVAPYLTKTGAGTQGLLATIINMDVWNSFPISVQCLMESLSDDALINYLGMDQNFLRLSVDAMVASGADFHVWSESDQTAALAMVQPAQTEAWIALVGADGTTLMTRLEEELAIYEPQSTYQSLFEIWEEEYGN